MQASLQMVCHRSSSQRHSTDRFGRKWPVSASANSRLARAVCTGPDGAMVTKLVVDFASRQRDVRAWPDHCTRAHATMDRLTLMLERGSRGTSLAALLTLAGCNALLDNEAGQAAGSGGAGQGKGSGGGDASTTVDGALLVTKQSSGKSVVWGSLTMPRQTLFTDTCPDGQAVIGLTGNYGSGIDSVGVRCGKLQISEDRSVKPYRYSVTTSPGQVFPPQGGGGGIVNGADQYLRCPPDQIMTGVAGWNDPTAGACPTDYCIMKDGRLCPSVYGLAVYCAGYDVVGRPGAFTLVQKTPPARTSDPIASANAPNLEARFFCPSAGVVREAVGGYAVWPHDCINIVVNGLQVSCTSPTIPFR